MCDVLQIRFIKCIWTWYFQHVMGPLEHNLYENLGVCGCLTLHTLSGKFCAVFNQFWNHSLLHVSLRETYQSPYLISILLSSFHCIILFQELIYLMLCCHFYWFAREEMDCKLHEWTAMSVLFTVYCVLHSRGSS